MMDLQGDSSGPAGGPRDSQNACFTYPNRRTVEPGSVVWFCNNLPVDVTIKFVSGSPFTNGSPLINVEANSVSYPLVVTENQGPYRYCIDAYELKYFGPDPVIIVDQPSGPSPSTGNS